MQQEKSKTQVQLARYKIYGIPTSYIDINWQNTSLPASEAARLEKIFASDLPTGSLLFVQGVAAPIANQLLSTVSKVRGIDMNERLSKPFESYDNPTADVIILFGLDNPVGSPKITKKVFDECVAFYRSIGALAIVESSDTATQFENNYGIKLVNKLVIKPKAEKSFLL